MQTRSLPLLAWALVTASCSAHEELPQREYPVHPAAHPDYDWVVHEGTGYRLHYTDELQVASHLAEFDQLLRLAHTNALALMGESDTAVSVPVFLVGSRADMKVLTGYEANGMTLPRFGVIVMVYTGGPNHLAIRHETMHLLTMALWHGVGPGPWVREGLGVLAGGQCSGYTPRAVAALSLEAGTLPALAELDSSFWELDEITAHLASASLIQFLHEQYGSDALRVLWSSGLPGLTAEIQLEATELELRWHAYLATTPEGSRLKDWSVVAAGCRWVPEAGYDAA